MTGAATGEAVRLDVELVRRGLVPSRAQARAAIEAGCVHVDGAIATKPGQIVTADSDIRAEAAHPWVSRGGLKLAHALEVFAVDPGGRVCLDIGASTGGFTDVLLARGAKKVVAVDVGRDQLHSRLKDDPRVCSLEQTDARRLTPAMIGEAPSLVVCDASFIGVEKLLSHPLTLAAAEAWLIGLFKPQFEVGPAHVGKRGIVTDTQAIDRAAARVEAWLKSAGWTLVGWTPSPIAGGDGNAERLFCCRNH